MSAQKAQKVPRHLLSIMPALPPNGKKAKTGLLALPSKNRPRVRTKRVFVAKSTLLTRLSEGRGRCKSVWVHKQHSRCHHPRGSQRRWEQREEGAERRQRIQNTAERGADAKRRVTTGKEGSGEREGVSALLLADSAISLASERYRKRVLRRSSCWCGVKKS